MTLIVLCHGGDGILSRVRSRGLGDFYKRQLQVLGVDAAPPLAWQQRFLREFGGAGVILTSEAFVAEVSAAPVDSAPLRASVASPSPIRAVAVSYTQLPLPTILSC